MIDLISKAIR